MKRGWGGWKSWDQADRSHLGIRAQEPRVLGSNSALPLAGGMAWVSSLSLPWQCSQLWNEGTVPCPCCPSHGALSWVHRTEPSPHSFSGAGSCIPQYYSREPACSPRVWRWCWLTRERAQGPCCSDLRGHLLNCATFSVMDSSNQRSSLKEHWPKCWSYFFNIQTSCLLPFFPRVVGSKREWPLSLPHEREQKWFSGGSGTLPQDPTASTPPSLSQLISKWRPYAFLCLLQGAYTATEVNWRPCTVVTAINIGNHTPPKEPTKNRFFFLNWKFP